MLFLFSCNLSTSKAKLVRHVYCSPDVLLSILKRESHVKAKRSLKSDQQRGMQEAKLWTGAAYLPTSKTYEWWNEKRISFQDKG